MSNTTTKLPKYDAEGMRLTDCCGAHSTYSDTTLCCKKCWREVDCGQGDGSEHLEAPVVTDVQRVNTQRRDYSYYDTTSFSLTYPIPVDGSLHDTVRGAIKEALDDGSLSFDVVTCRVNEAGEAFVVNTVASVKIHDEDV